MYVTGFSSFLINGGGSSTLRKFYRTGGLGGVGGSSAVIFPESVWLNHSPIPLGIGEKC